MEKIDDYPNNIDLFPMVISSGQTLEALFEPLMLVYSPFFRMQVLYLKFLSMCCDAELNSKRIDVQTFGIGCTNSFPPFSFIKGQL